MLVGDCGAFQTQWIMGRVVDVHPGSDGLVRAADVEVSQATPLPAGTLGRTSAAAHIHIKKTVFRRPVVKLCRLFHEEEDPGQDMTPVHPPRMFSPQWLNSRLQTN